MYIDYLILILLAIFGTFFGLIIVCIFDYKAVMEKGFFQGYTTVVWLVVFLQVIDNKLIFFLF
jgi:hypothetical protein